MDDQDDVSQDGLVELIQEKAEAVYTEKENEFGDQLMSDLQKFVFLQSVDNQWKDHLLSMDHLKEGIGLRGYGQRDPLREYQREAYEMFADMIERIKEESIRILFNVKIQREEDLAKVEPREQEISLSHGEGDAKAQPVKRKEKKIGRNDPCPCGSGKKYKKCCGANA